MTAHVATGHIIGILVADPERRVTVNNKVVTSFQVHCDFEDQRSGTYWVVLWAHNCDDFIENKPVKGDLVEVEGRITNRKTKKLDAEGKIIWVTEVVGKAKVLEAVGRVNPTDPSPASMDPNDPSFVPF